MSRDPPTSAVPDDEHAWQTKVDRWISSVTDFTATYDGNVTEFGESQTALLPRWRQRQITLVSGRVAWLEAQQHELGCESETERERL